MRLPRLIPVAAACLSMACAAAIPAMATGPLPAASDVGRTVLAGTAPTWAQRTAPTVSRGATSAIVLLKPSATDAERRDVTGWLRSQGIHVDRDRASIHAMSMSGPRAALAHAFDTTFVRQRVSGRTAVVHARALSVPSGLNAVQSVAGLVDTDAAVPTTVAAPQTSDDCAAYWGQKLSADLAGLGQGRPPFQRAVRIRTAAAQGHPRAAAGRDGPGRDHRDRRRVR